MSEKQITEQAAETDGTHQTHPIPSADGESSTVPDQTGSTETDDEQPEREPRGAEAKRYRLKLRETEAERDALTEHLTALRRASVDDKVKGHKITPEGFWASGVQLEDLLDDDGHLDADKIKTAADTAAETLGLERIGTRGPYVPKEGNITNPGKSVNWEAAFRAK